MARRTAASTIVSLMNKIRSEWHAVVTRLGELDATFDELGITTEPVFARGRPGSPKGTTSTKRKAGRRKRGTFAQTADEFVLGLLKSKKMTSGQVNKAWKAAGRAGVSNTVLTKLTKAKKLVRRAVKGARGGKFSAA